MTSVDSTALGAAPTPAPNPGIEPQRPPGPLLRAWRDCAGLVSLTLRLVWRHWPVLLSLALAGTIGRELVITAAAESAHLDALAGLLVVLLAPVAVMVAMVLMLRTVRPSLPRIRLTPREPVLNHLGGVLIAFLVFYQTSGFLVSDYLRFEHSIASEDFRTGAYAFGATPDVRSPLEGVGITTLTIVAAAALAIRWLLNRFEVVRRRPVLGVPAAYFEIVWIFAALLLANNLLERFGAWRDQRVVWRAGLEIWRSDFAPLGEAAGPLQGVRDFLTVIWASTTPVLVVPVTALLTGAVVLAVSTGALSRPRLTKSRIARMLRIGGYAGRSYGRLAGLIRFFSTLRLVFRSGAVMMMAFCLLFVATLAVDELLNEPERALIGPQSVFRVWDGLYYPLQWFNEAVGLVLVMCLIAAAVERSPLGAGARARNESAGQVTAS